MITRLLVLLPMISAQLEKLPELQRRIVAAALVAASVAALAYLAWYRPDEALTSAAVAVLTMAAGLLTSSPVPPSEPPPEPPIGHGEGGLD